MKKIFGGNDLFALRQCDSKAKPIIANCQHGGGGCRAKQRAVRRGGGTDSPTGRCPPAKYSRTPLKATFCVRGPQHARSNPLRPSPCALSSFPSSFAAFCPPHVCQSESVGLQVLHSPPASPSIRYRDQRSFQWDIASSAQRARHTPSRRPSADSPSLPPIHLRLTQ